MLVIVCYIFYNDVTSALSSLNCAVGPARGLTSARWGLTPARWGLTPARWGLTPARGVTTFLPQKSIWTNH
jgi:hypothetical protein